MRSKTEITHPRDHGLLSRSREDPLNFDALDVFLDSSLLKRRLETES
jgi:hypothetical protein